MAEQPSTEQVKSLCARADLLSIVYQTMRKLLEQHADKLTREFATNPIYRSAPKVSQINVKKESSPHPLNKFHISMFVEPTKSDATFQSFAYAVEEIAERLKDVRVFYNRNTQSFDHVGFSNLPLDKTPNLCDYVKLFDQIAEYTRIANEIRKLLLA